MKNAAPITCLFLDIGGVLLTNGWDHRARQRAAKNFKLRLAEMEDRHHLTFDTYEEGKLTLAEYLDRVVFHQRRSDLLICDNDSAVGRASAHFRTVRGDPGHFFTGIHRRISHNLTAEEYTLSAKACDNDFFLHGSLRLYKPIIENDVY